MWSYIVGISCLLFTFITTTTTATTIIVAFVVVIAIAVIVVAIASVFNVVIQSYCCRFSLFVGDDASCKKVCTFSSFI